ncbi:MAG: LacI family DNA-binding transcriptional regulator [Rhizobiales bacterium]|nr:LacI family DNA-binding transcriptional regulator [Hyphomicrobiales bacterium]
MDHSGKRVNQADIAEAAGVSTATVSRALNGTGIVTPEARKRIDAAIAELGYMPHGAARALASRRSHTVGAVIPTLASAIFAAGIDAFERHLNEAGLTMLLALSNYDLDIETLKVRRLLERGVDAIALVGNAHSPEVHELITRAGVPYVHTWAWSPDAVHPHVGFSNFEAARQVAHHLADLGHSNIGMIAGIAKDNDRATQRVAGTRQGLIDRGLVLQDNQIIEAAYTHAAARQALRTLIKDGQGRPTAIVCGNDVLATGALIEAQAHEIDVPGELSLTGFDDLPLAAHLNPPLTTIVVPAEKMGQTAATALIAALELGEPARGQQLEARLVIRQTTAPPPPKHN